VVIQHTCSIVRKFLSDEFKQVKRLTTPNRTSLACPQLYALISTFPDATPAPPPQQMLD